MSKNAQSNCTNKRLMLTLQKTTVSLFPVEIRTGHVASVCGVCVEPSVTYVTVSVDIVNITHVTTVTTRGEDRPSRN